jgi:hypothetical protein
MITLSQFLTESEAKSDLSKFVELRKKSDGTEAWAFIDIHDKSKVFKWFDSKPSDQEIKHELDAIEYFKHND